MIHRETRVPLDGPDYIIARSVTMNYENRIKKLEETTRPRPLIVLSDKERDRLLNGWTPPEDVLVIVLTSWD